MVHPLSISYAEELCLKPREARERRKCRPLTTRAEHALREVDLADRSRSAHAAKRWEPLHHGMHYHRMQRPTTCIAIYIHCMQAPLPYCCGLRAHEAIMQCKPCGQHVNHACRMRACLATRSLACGTKQVQQAQRARCRARPPSSLRRCHERSLLRKTIARSILQRCKFFARCLQWGPEATRLRSQLRMRSACHAKPRNGARLRARLDDFFGLSNRCLV